MNLRSRRNLVHGVTLALIAVGVAAFAFVTLPQQLGKAGAVPAQRANTLPSLNISSLLPPMPESTAAKPQPVHGTIAKFVPEGMPSDPFAPRPMSAPNADLASEIAAGGAGAAIEDDGLLLARQEAEAAAPPPPPAAAPTDADLAVGDPYGSAALTPEARAALVEAPKVHELKSSSFSRRERPATDTEKGRSERPWMNTPAGLEADVAFWREVYGRYDRNQVVLHHPRYLQIVYGIVDLSDVDTDPRLNDIEKGHLRESRVDEARKSIIEILKKLAAGPNASSLSEEEWRIRKLFDGVQEADAFRRAAEEDGVRAQLGQRDKFIRGLAYSGRYLGEIEAIFESYGLPRELTRLIFVESMFNIKARSSVGASGIWQFMPATGKLYLNINSVVDERNDPIAATHAAARLLRHNYESLGTWPLAINAYNAGRVRLQQAVEALGTNDIGRIIRNFSHPAYGFASRNFFLEFLAAYDVAEHAEKYFGQIVHDQPLKYETVHTQYNVSFPEVARIARLDLAELQELNPRFTGAIFSGSRPLPVGYEIRVPPGRGELFLAAAARAPQSRTGPVNHVVQNGETLPSIASMYGVSPAAILKSNRHVGRTLVPGQKLLIPTHATR